MAEEQKGKKNSDASSITLKDELQELEHIPYPKCVFFILSTEACERFSYYGMRAILSLYLRHLFVSIKHLDNDTAENRSTIIYHTFVFLSYFTALIGAFLSDSFLGKFRTIFYISIVYAIGQIILSIGAIPSSDDVLPNNPQLALSYIGLILIGFGTGGIKPCVVSFGAEQFTLPQQAPQMDTFFGIFYAAINFGSMISTILTPIFRKTPCLGEENCYPLAFGVPAVLMIIAIIFFVLGRPGYKIAIPTVNIVKMFFQAIGTAISERRKGRKNGIKKDHWMDYAEDRFGKQFVEDVKAVLRICIIFCLYPLFWALYDQQGSRWTFQASRMDGQYGNVQILPDQMQVINAALILIYIPIFDKIVYPLFDKFGLLKTPLQRIVTGGTLLAISFIMSACVELQLEKTYPNPPRDDTARLAFHNGFGDGFGRDRAGCQLDIILDNPGGGEPFNLTVPPGMTAAFEKEESIQLLPFSVSESGMNLNATISISQYSGSTCRNKYTSHAPITLENFKIQGGNSTTFFVYPDSEGEVQYFMSEYSDEVDKSESGNPWMRMMYDLPGITPDTWIVFSTDEFGDEPNYEFDKESRKGRGAVWGVENGIENKTRKDVGAEVASIMADLKLCVYDWQGIDKLCVDVEDSYNNHKMYEYRYGGSFNHYLVAYKNATDQWALRVDLEVVTEPNSVDMMWLLPQYFVLTAGEVLFSITSLQFSFTQAPGSMKAVVQALYLLTTALGNLIDIIVVGALSSLFESQASEFFLFAGLMLLDMLGLALLAMRYKYVDYSNTDVIPDYMQPDKKDEERRDSD